MVNRNGLPQATEATKHWYKKTHWKLPINPPSWCGSVAKQHWKNRIVQ